MSTTVVTAFYPLKRSKHTISQYRQWIRNFCKIPCNLTVFTDAETGAMISAERNSDLPTHMIITPFDSYAMTSPSMMKFWAEQHAKDPERTIHSPELYAVWAMKQECVSLAIADNIYASEWFVWCDIGIQRDVIKQHLYANFPKHVPDLCEPGRISILEVYPISSHFVDVWQTHSTHYDMPANALGAGCMAGDIVAWHDFCEAYISMIHTFNKRNLFAGKEQNIYFAMLIEHATKKPFKLYYSTRHAGLDHWMSFPVILGGDAPGLIDTRFST